MREGELGSIANLRIHALAGSPICAAVHVSPLSLLSEYAVNAAQAVIRIGGVDGGWGGGIDGEGGEARSRRKSDRDVPPLVGTVGRLEDLPVRVRRERVRRCCIDDVRTRRVDRNRRNVDPHPVRPLLALVQDEPPSTLFKTPAGPAPRKSVELSDGAIAKAVTSAVGRTSDGAAQCAAPSVLLYTDEPIKPDTRPAYNVDGETGSTARTSIDRPYSPRFESVQWAPPSVVLVTASPKVA